MTFKHLQKRSRWRSFKSLCTKWPPLASRHALRWMV